MTEWYRQAKFAGQFIRSLPAAAREVLDPLHLAGEPVREVEVKRW